MPIDASTRKLLEIFFRYDRKRQDELGKTGRLLAHYTTAETAAKIISNKCLWLRNAAVMNDFSEVEYGRAVMTPVLNGLAGQRLKNALNALDEGMGERVFERHGTQHQHARETVFMASLSEHDPDNLLGRLSMWRAYGGPVAGVALLFHGWAANLEIDPSLLTNLSPVLYGNERKFEIELMDIVESIESSRDFLKSFDPMIIESVAVYVLQFAMLSIKHPGFEEEREWRLIYRPYEDSSAAMMCFNMAVGGIPQTIYRFPFHNPSSDPLHDIPELDLDKILAGIMIGPCAYPETVFRALVEEMTAAGITNPSERITVSNIPLRQRW